MGSASSQPADFSAESYALVNLFLGLTTLAILARATSRHLQEAAFGFDDGFAWAAYITNAVALIVENTLIALGVMNLERYTQFTLTDFKTFTDSTRVNSIMYIITMASAKLSVLFLCRRIFGMFKPWFKILWWVNLVFIVCWSGATLGQIIWFQVTKLAYGNTQAANATAATCLVNVLSDILILVLPVGGVLKLQLSGLRKTGILAIFSLGLITTCISLVRLVVELQAAANGPFSWNAVYSNYNYSMVAFAETSAAVLCACTPVVRKCIAMIGDIASRNLSLLSLRPSTRRSSGTDLSTGSDKKAGPRAAREVDGRLKLSRTISVDVESMEGQPDQVSREARERSIVLGFIPRKEGVTHVTTGA